MAEAVGEQWFPPIAHTVSIPSQYPGNTLPLLSLVRQAFTSIWRLCNVSLNTQPPLPATLIPHSAYGAYDETQLSPCSLVWKVDSQLL